MAKKFVSLDRLSKFLEQVRALIPATDAALSTESVNPVQNKAVTAALDGKAASSHTHDDRYYTESEVDTKLDNLFTTVHTW